MSALLLRPAGPDDMPALIDLFRRSVLLGAAEHYDVRQRQAWIAVAKDEEAFTVRLDDAATVMAERAGTPLGFASFGDERIDMLYVDPAHHRQGVARALIEAVELIALTSGIDRLSVDASDAAEPFFAALGYLRLRRNRVERAGVVLANTTMEKRLEAQSHAGDA
ncbi:MAG: GNAT family N-acetyltransferase [Hyphomicrobiaceae bacterium]|nr:GNAT family N-acetyltransferase [Hyphomicrobiaceae bacterium]